MMEKREPEESAAQEDRSSNEQPDAPPDGTGQDEAAVFRDRWIRVSADLDNLRKRTERDIEAARRQERAKILGDFLSVVDNLDRALLLAGPQTDEWLEGVDATRRQMLDLLAQHGVEPFESMGARFDPKRHEAVSVVQRSDRPEAKVVEVIEKGYLLDGELLRAARVVVTGGIE